MDNYKNTLQEMCQKSGYKLPEYRLEDEGGSSNRPSFVVSVTVEWNGQTLMERAAATGKKKKEVEKMAAKQMIERINNGFAQTPVGSSLATRSPLTREQSRVSSTPPSVRRAADTSPMPDIYDGPVGSPSSRAKNELQELLQKSIFNYPPPEYDHLAPRGPSHKREFTCRCLVKDNHDQVIHETQGSASTKKVAEMNAAKEMIPFIRAMLEDGGQLIPQGRPRTYHRTPPRELLDPALDADLFDRLFMYTPHFELVQGKDDLWLCLAIAQSGCRAGEPAVASHGVGDSESAARREAGLNLIHNLQGLGYIICGNDQL